MGGCDLAVEFKQEAELNSQFCEVGPISILRVSAKAFLVSFIDGREGRIPKDCIENNQIQRWLLVRKGLDDLIDSGRPRAGQETVSIGGSELVIVAPYSSQTLRPGEIVVVHPDTGKMLIVR